MPSAREKAMKLFQKMRRMQCASRSGFAECISCGKVLPWEKLDGGHYESRKNRATELEPDNVWGQCKYCNGTLEGNKIAYRNRLINRIGLQRVLRIEDLAMAAKGSEEAMERLSESDRELVRCKRKDKDYEQLAIRYAKIIRMLEKDSTHV